MRFNFPDFVDDRVDDGVFRVHRRVFSDPAIFDLEMKYIFERTWVFLGLESQLPRPNDYLTTVIGRHPVVVMRDNEGDLGCFLNSCPHKGATLCPLMRGNKRLHVCPYHSWSFDSAGRNRAIKGLEKGRYAPAFEALNHDMIPIARFASYRGLMFGALSADVPSLEEHLGGARAMIDIAAAQSEQGLEVLPGAVSFTFAGNWKMQLENCSDAYHFSSTHPSYLRLLDRRKEEGVDVPRAISGADYWLGEAERPLGGSICFDHGHVLNWNHLDVTPALPLYDAIAALDARVGRTKRDWMLRLRNLTLYPNVQLAENVASQLRIIRPISVDRTEMLTYCLAPVGEAPERRALRIRQYEEFFNPSGLATPDDASAYEACQSGHRAVSGGWLQGYSRGMTGRLWGGDMTSEDLDAAVVSASSGCMQLGDETIFHGGYRQWRALIEKGLREERTEA